MSRSKPASSAKPTPAATASAKPRLTGAPVFGVRPGSPLRHRITAIGAGPLRFEADGLPKGVNLDSKTGILTGGLRAPGRHTVRVRVSGPSGADERDFTLACGSRLALTPPMGWNSWNCWAKDVSADKVLSSARALEHEGLGAHGWSYINIDDAWQGERARTGDHALQGNEKFPDMEGLVSEIQGLGLRAGIYSSPWSVTYGNHPGDSSDDPKGQGFVALPEENWWVRRAQLYNSKGRYSFAAADAKQYARWGFDYLKYDWFPIDAPTVINCANALRDSGRDIILSLSNTLALSTLPDVIGHAQLWRTTNDLRDDWFMNTSTPYPFQGVRDVARWHEAYQGFQSPGAWNDPDMLVLGRVGWSANLRPSKLTPDEQTSHFALWCLWSAPLLIGCPVDQLDPHTRGLLTNADLIDLDQDTAGVQAWQKPGALGKNPEHVLYYKPLANGDSAVGIFNYTERAAEITIDIKKHAERSVDTQRVLDCLAQKDLGEKRGKLTVSVPSHGCAVYRFSNP